jgi:hypothetical protein
LLNAARVRSNGSNEMPAALQRGKQRLLPFRVLVQDDEIRVECAHEDLLDRNIQEAAFMRLDVVISPLRHETRQWASPCR